MEQNEMTAEALNVNVNNSTNNETKENGQMENNVKKTVEAEATLTPEQKEQMIEQLIVLEDQIKAKKKDEDTIAKKINVKADSINKLNDEIATENDGKAECGFAIGRILGEIRKGKLFKAMNSKDGKPFTSIGAYAEERLDFKKSYVCQIETAYNVLEAVTNARTNDADYDLPKSVDAAYKLRIFTKDAEGKNTKELDTQAMVDVLKAIKAVAGATVNAKTIEGKKPKGEHKVSEETKKKIFMNHMESAKKNLKAELNKLSSKEEKQAKLDGLQEILDELKKELEATEQE